MVDENIWHAGERRASPQRYPQNSNGAQEHGRDLREALAQPLNLTAAGAGSVSPQSIHQLHAPAALSCPGGQVSGAVTTLEQVSLARSPSFQSAPQAHASGGIQLQEAAFRQSPATLPNSVVPTSPSAAQLRRGIDQLGPSSTTLNGEVSENPGKTTSRSNSGADSEVETADWIMQMLQKPSPPMQFMTHSQEMPGTLLQNSFAPAVTTSHTHSPLDGSELFKGFHPVSSSVNDIHQTSMQTYGHDHYFVGHDDQKDSVKSFPAYLDTSVLDTTQQKPGPPVRSSSLHGYTKMDHAGLRVTTSDLSSQYPQLNVPSINTTHWRELSANDLSPISPSGASLSPMTAHSPFSYSPGPSSDVHRSPDPGALAAAEQCLSPQPLTSPFAMGPLEGYTDAMRPSVKPADYLGDFDKLLASMPGLTRSSSHQPQDSIGLLDQAQQYRNQPAQTLRMPSQSSANSQNLFGVDLIDSGLSQNRRSLQAPFRDTASSQQDPTSGSGSSQSMPHPVIARSNSWSGPGASAFDRQQMQQRMQLQRKISALRAVGIDPVSPIGQAYLASVSDAQPRQQDATSIPDSRQQGSHWPLQHPSRPQEEKIPLSDVRDAQTVAPSAPELLLHPSTPTFSVISDDAFQQYDKPAVNLGDYHATTIDHPEMRRASLQHTQYQHSSPNPITPFAAQNSAAPTIRLDAVSGEAFPASFDQQNAFDQARAHGVRQHRALSDSCMSRASGSRDARGRQFVVDDVPDLVSGSSSPSGQQQQQRTSSLHHHVGETYALGTHHRGRSENNIGRQASIRRKISVSPHRTKHRQFASEDLDRIKTQRFLAQITGLDGGLAPPDRNRAGYQDVVASDGLSSPFTDPSRSGVPPGGHAYSQSMPSFSTTQTDLSVSDPTSGPSMPTLSIFESVDHGMGLEAQNLTTISPHSAHSFNFHSRSPSSSSIASSFSFNSQAALPAGNMNYASNSSHRINQSQSSEDLNALSVGLGSNLPIPAVANPTTAATQAASESRRKNSAQFSCPFPGCDSTFTRQYNLRGHMRSHMDERPFVCDWPSCDKSFARAHDCKRHQQLHFGFRPYLCACGRNFARLDALHRHLRMDPEDGCERILNPRSRMAMAHANTSKQTDFDPGPDRSTSYSNLHMEDLA